MTNQPKFGYSGQVPTALVDKIIATAYEHTLKLSGEDILKLSPVNQLNMFILESLFNSWQESSSALQSTLFDFSHPEVASAFNNLKNTLSRHIALKKEDAIPLLNMSLIKLKNMVEDPAGFKSGHNEGIEKNKFLKTFEDFFKQGGPQPSETEIAIAKSQIDAALEEKYGIRIWSEEIVDHMPAPIIVPEDRTAKSYSGNEKGASAWTVTLNQRIMFTKSLFSGNKVDFEAALSTIDSMTSFDEALEFVKNRFADPNSWDFESDEVAEFLEVLEKKFTL